MMVGWHHRLNRCKFEQTPRDSEAQGSLACGSPWNCRVGHDLATEQPQLCHKSKEFSLPLSGFCFR